MTGGSSQGARRFHIVSVGWGAPLITGILDRVEAATGYRLTHIMLNRDRGALPERPGRGEALGMLEHPRVTLPPPDRELLGALERPDVPTIHNMIMGDRVVRLLAYDEALAYATHLARRFERLFRQLEPSVVIGGPDSMHSGIALAVARKLGIPWFFMAFSTIPKGLSCFCTGMTPDTGVALNLQGPDALRSLAERTLEGFERRELAVPAYLSENSLVMVIKRLPAHGRTFAAAAVRAATGQRDFTEYSLPHLLKAYFRRRVNLLALPRGWLCEEPPAAPYVFFGLHMQPESSIDVWAPFHANQASVIESLARSLPPTHRLLVKLHKSDADNYGRRELDRLRRLPGVQLVSPFASSRAFIDGASLVAAIQGTIALEAALLGKPVLMFGESRVAELPSVTRVGSITELPGLVRRKLAEPRPDREAIVRGFMSFLSVYAPACYNDWNTMPSDAEIAALTEQFVALRRFLVSPACAE